MNEHPFMKHLLLALGAQPWCRVWRQNVGKVLVRDDHGRPLRQFDAGPPPGVADISGFVRPDGWRLEVEVKADGGERRREQRAFERVALAGGVVYVLVEYSELETLEQNVARAVDCVREAIRERRKRAA